MIILHSAMNDGPRAVALLSAIIASSTMTMVKGATFVREEVYYSAVSVVMQAVSNHYSYAGSVKYWIHTSHM